MTNGAVLSKRSRSKRSPKSKASARDESAEASKKRKVNSEVNVKSQRLIEVSTDSTSHESEAFLLLHGDSSEDGDDPMDSRRSTRRTQSTAKRGAQLLTDGPSSKQGGGVQKKRKLDKSRSAPVTNSKPSRKPIELSESSDENYEDDEDEEEEEEDRDPDEDEEDDEEEDEEDEDDENEDEDDVKQKIDKIFACRWRKVALCDLESTNEGQPLNPNTSNTEADTNNNNVSNSSISSSSTELVIPVSHDSLPSISPPSTSIVASTAATSDTTASASCSALSNSPIMNGVNNGCVTSDVDIPSFPSSVSNSPSLAESLSIDQSSRVMEYLVKYEGRGFRNLEWKTRSELVKEKNDSADLKILHFHRKMSGGVCDEVDLSPQDEGNFILYRKIDRIISVRIADEETDGNSKLGNANNQKNKKKKEYLVKWELLGYSMSTWESESDLQSSEDQAALARFIQVNKSFEFPVCTPPPGVTMAVATQTDSRKDRSRKKNEPEGKVEEIMKDAIPASQIKGENYKTDAVTQQEGTTRLWQTFLRRKMAKDGTYIPSMREIKGSDGKIESYSRSLMGHQQEGLKWMFFNTEVNRHGSLLADEMGLGKTCQAITFLEHYLDIMSAGKNAGCHALIVVQKSLLENWRREFQAWASHLNVLALYGSHRDREIVKKYEYKWMKPETGDVVNPPNNLSSKKLMKPDVVVVTYEGLRTQEFRQLTNRNFKWSVVVIDECQKIKAGKASLLLQLLAQTKRELTILLTGTPVQNTTEELFPMLTLLHPSRFYYEEGKDTKRSTDSWDFARFCSKFSQIQDRDDCMKLTEELHHLMAPYILRREKAHVLKTLPPKTVKLIKIPLTLLQKRVYSVLYHKSIRTKGLKFANIHMQLRKCCIHPYLIEGMEQLIFDGKIGDSNEKNCDSMNSDASEEILLAAKSETLESADEKTKRLILESSGKFVLLKKMLESLRQANRKVLIFSFFKTALDLIEDFIQLYGYPWTTERVDGDTPGEERQLSIDRFNSDPNRFLFLCTTRAGGLGINLSAASVVIHLDSDFNPQHDLQAQARCHRIGQDKSVDVMHFIAEHTYEDYMLFTIAGKKLGLEAVLLGRLDATKGKPKLDRNQEEKVLRKGVFAAIRDDEAAGRDAAEFANSSIEEILSAKSSTVVLENGGRVLIAEDTAETVSTGDDDIDIGDASVLKPSPSLDRGSGAPHTFFSTAKFAVNDNSGRDTLSGLEGLDEDEPDFWVKVAQRLGPWVLEEEKPRKELTRADRRRGKNVNYRSAFYDDEFFTHDGRRGRRQHPDINGIAEGSSSGRKEGSGQKRDSMSHGDSVDFGENDDDEDEDEDAYVLHSGSSDGSDSDDDSDDEDNGSILKDDMDVITPSNTDRLPGSTKLSRRRREPKLTSDVAAHGKKHPKLRDNFELTLEPASASASASASAFASTTTPDSASPLTLTLPSGHRGSFLVMDLLFRCLRALKCWRSTKVGESGGLRTEDIREGDRCSPWSLSAVVFKPPIDKLLMLSWLDTLQEWKQSGVDWEAKFASIVDQYAKRVLETRRGELEQKWFEHLKTYNVLSSVKSKEQLIQQMNKFFISDSRRLAIHLFSEQILQDLQHLCHELLATVLTGRHFSREFTAKKQTWIGAEDFCIKAVFIHLMAQKYAGQARNQVSEPSVMRWPPPLLEINWGVVTEVIKKLNQYTGGPERRRSAVHERFYNKLDSRWNHDEFSLAEREALAIAVANGLSPHVVAEELPGRSLERVKKGLRCPSVIRESQRPEYAVNQPIEHNGQSPAVVDIIKHFRKICQGLGLSKPGDSPRDDTDDCDLISSNPSPQSSINKQSTLSPQLLSTSSFSPIDSQVFSDWSNHSIKCPPLSSQAISMATKRRAAFKPDSSHSLQNYQSSIQPQTANELLIESIKNVLLRIGVHPNDFEALRPSLFSQPLENLATLLKQLRDVQVREARGGVSQQPSSQPSASRTPSTPSAPPTPKPHVITSGVSVGRSVQGNEGVSSHDVVIIDDDIVDEQPQDRCITDNGKVEIGSQTSTLAQRELSENIAAQDFCSQKQVIIEQLRRREALLEIEQQALALEAQSMDKEIFEKKRSNLEMAKLHVQQKLGLVIKATVSQRPLSPGEARSKFLRSGVPGNGVRISSNGPGLSVKRAVPPDIPASGAQQQHRQQQSGPSTASSSSTSVSSPSVIQQQHLLQFLYKFARPEQVEEIQRRMDVDPGFAAKVLEQIKQIQKKTTSVVPQDLQCEKKNAILNDGNIIN